MDETGPTKVLSLKTAIAHCKKRDIFLAKVKVAAE